MSIDKIRLPKGARTLSSEHLMHRHGGEMWDDLKNWLTEQRRDPPYGDDYYTTALLDCEGIMKVIEKQYGVTYVE